ncbi:rhomboid family intramembrane serine protease [Phycisphaerales bacterium AB-hyl4]|uniref:Rhomboid family intramembrane serine protease n=1 Tax=Natronomicrosphaera hydrolytica TaxID=3242702 RepID=A0ABV4UAR8_9BACT
MGWQEREYGQDPMSRLGSAGGVARFGQVGIIYPRWGSISLWIILINAALLLIDGFVTRIAGGPTPSGLNTLAHFFSFSVVTTFQQFRLYELITFQFQHYGLGHFFGNMIFMFFFGPMVESYFGSRRFLAYYLLAGVGGVLGYLVLWGLQITDISAATTLVGASGGVFGVMVAALFVAPNARVLLFFLIPVPLKAMVFLALFIAVFVLVAGGPNPGGEAAHLGGALAGLVMFRIKGSLDWADRLGGSREGPTLAERWAQKREAKRRQQQLDEEAEVDRILEKVKQQGLQSLTGAEKKTLSRATQRKRGG